MDIPNATQPPRSAVELCSCNKEAFLVKPQLQTPDEAISNVKEGMAYTRATHGERLPADTEKKRLKKGVSPTQLRGACSFGRGHCNNTPLCQCKEGFHRPLVNQGQDT